MTRIPH